ncbi:MAG: hypothetical protein ABIL58_22955 [Pseudomonadota bacterium]
MTHRRMMIKWGLTVAGVLIVILCLSPGVAVVNDTVFGSVDVSARAYLDRTLIKAATTFAVVRSINGIISVIQGSHIMASPAGVGVSLAVGEVLDPVNDLMERFSWIMLLSTTSLGIQSVFFDMGIWMGSRILLPAGIAVVLLGWWCPGGVGRGVQRLGVRLIIAAIVVRFCVPAISLAGDYVYRRFLDDRYQNAAQVLGTIGDQVKEVERQTMDPAGTTQAPSAGIFDTMARYAFDEAAREAFSHSLETLRRQLADYARSTIDLITVFLLQTLLLPLLFLWAGGRMLAGLLRLPILPGVGP